MSKNNERLKCPPNKEPREGYYRRAYDRKDYKRKNGTPVHSAHVKETYVPASCIERTGLYPGKRSELDKKKIAERDKIHKEVAKKFNKTYLKCPAGEVERAGYTRRAYERRPYNRTNGIHVNGAYVKPSMIPPVCIKEHSNSRGEYGGSNQSKNPKRSNMSSKSTKKKIKIPVVLKKGSLKKYGYDKVKRLSLQNRHKALRTAVEDTDNPLSIFRKLIVISTMEKNTDPEASRIFHNDAYWVRDNFGLMRTPPHVGPKYRRDRHSNKLRESPEPIRSKTSKSKPKSSGSKTSKSSTKKRK